MAEVIRFVCRASAHQGQAQPQVPSNPITFHAGSWAYCASGAAAEHDWEAIPAASLDDVRQRTNGQERRRAMEQS